MRHRTILHVRLDGLCAVVERHKDPGLAGKPFVVCRNTASSTILDVSDEAASVGVRRGQPLWRVRSSTRGLVIIPPDPAAYQAATRRATAEALRFTPQLKPLRADELLLDVTGSLRLFGGVTCLVHALQEALVGKLDVLPTVGVGPNPLTAKIATALAEPQCIYEISAEQAPEVLEPLSVSYLWTVQRAQRYRLRQMGVGTLGQLRRIPSAILRKEFGDRGLDMFEAARGRDDTIIPLYEMGDPELAVRSGYEMPRPTRQAGDIRRAATALVQEVARLLRNRNQSARKLVLVFETDGGKRLEPSRVLKESVDLEADIARHVEDILEHVHLGARRCVRMELAALDLRDAPAVRQLSLFEERPMREGKLAEARDKVSRRMSGAAIMPALLEGASLP